MSSEEAPAVPKKKWSKRRKIIVSSSIISSILIVALLACVVIPYFSQIDRTYSWSYGGSEWTLNKTIPGNSYSHYKESSHTYQELYGASGYVYYVTDNDPEIESLAHSLYSDSVLSGCSKYETISFILAFIQSLPYTSDAVTTGHDEYPRYPLETLVDYGGDCEDTAILFASIVQTDWFNHDATLFLYPSHMAVGVWGSPSLGGGYYYQERYYLYCETTSDGWKIGEIPDEYEDVTPTFIDV